MMSISIKLAWLTLITVFVFGCVAIQPFPYIARAGDTITLAVGSLDGAKKDNITVLYYADSDPSTPIDMTADVRSVIKIFPDKTSKAYHDSSTYSMLQLTKFNNHGPWQTVVVLDLPLSTPAGTGHFEISFGPEVIYPTDDLKKVDDVDIALEILADTNNNALTGSPHQFEYKTIAVNDPTETGDLTALEQLRQVVVRKIPLTNRPAATGAAASYELIVPVVDSFGNDVSDQVTNSQFAVVLDDHPEYIRNQVSLNWSRADNLFKVIVTSLSGAQDFNRVRYSILISDLDLEATNGWVLGTPTMVSAQLFDLNGNDISGSYLKPPAKLQ